MRALAITRFGDTGGLEELEVPTPEPGLGEVAIDVAYAGLNYAEVFYRRGAVPVPLPFVPGIEVAGHVRALGPGVSGMQVGDPVAGLTIVNSGGYAEVAVTDARLVASLAADVGDRELARAAAVPSNTTTAFLVLEVAAHLHRGERVLVHAAAGGVGSQLGQIARLLGAGHVAGSVGSPEKRPAAEAFGYHEVLLREALLGTPASVTPFDVIVDPVGGLTRRASYRVLALGGRLVAMGNASAADDVPFGANELWLDGRTVAGFNLAAYAGAFPERTGAALRRALDAVESGTVTVALQDPLPLNEAAAGHQLIESGRSTGKLVLAVE